MEYDHRQNKLHSQFNTRLLASKYDQLDELITKESYDLESERAQDRKAQDTSEARRKQTSSAGATRKGQNDSSEAAPVGKLDDLFSQLKGEQLGGVRKLNEITQFATNEAMADPRYTEPDNDDKTHLPSGMSARNLKATLPAVMIGGGEGVSRRDNAQKYEGNEKALMLLDPSNRPTWNGSAAAGMTTAQHDNDDMSVDDHGPLNTVANNDLYPFINKNTPKINVRYTVGGLEKRLADTHWKRRDSTSSSKGTGEKWHKNKGHAPLSRRMESFNAGEMNASFDSRPITPHNSAINSRPTTANKTGAPSLSNAFSSASGESESPPGSPQLNRLHHSRIIEDEFTAYHNRGIVNFRLGADESGLSDMETAMKLKPSHEVTREVLSLAKRRM
eukprot:gene33417-41232_t